MHAHEPKSIHAHTHASKTHTHTHTQMHGHTYTHTPTQTDTHTSVPTSPFTEVLRDIIKPSRKGVCGISGCPSQSDKKTVIK